MNDRKQIAVLVGRALGKGLLWLLAAKLGQSFVTDMGVTPDALIEGCGAAALVGLNIYDSVATRNTLAQKNSGEYSPPRQ